jgi:quinol-cytochrome oxidoreductase complex cytochrome b subunit
MLVVVALSVVVTAMVVGVICYMIEGVNQLIDKPQPYSNIWYPIEKRNPAPWYMMPLLRDSRTIYLVEDIIGTVVGIAIVAVVISIRKTIDFYEIVRGFKSASWVDKLTVFVILLVVVVITVCTTGCFSSA